MAQKEQETKNPLIKYLIPPCIALPFNMTILKDHKSGNCIAVTEDGECPHAKRRHHAKDKFECRKDTLMKTETPTLAMQQKIIKGFN